MHTNLKLYPPLLLMWGAVILATAGCKKKEIQIDTCQEYRDQYRDLQENKFKVQYFAPGLSQNSYYEYYYPPLNLDSTDNSKTFYYTAPEVYTDVRWQFGEEADLRSGKQIMLSYPMILDSIAITMIGKRPPYQCLPDDDGIDSFTQIQRFYLDTGCVMPHGNWKGKNVGVEEDSFTIKIANWHPWPNDSFKIHGENCRGEIITIYNSLKNEPLRHSQSVRFGAISKTEYWMSFTENFQDEAKNSFRYVKMKVSPDNRSIDIEYFHLPPENEREDLNAPYGELDHYVWRGRRVTL